jgi:hypothetical protein
MVSFQVGQAQSARGWASAKSSTNSANRNLKKRTPILLSGYFSPSSRCRVEMIEHPVDHDAGDGNVKPKRQRDARYSPVSS